MADVERRQFLQALWATALVMPQSVTPINTRSEWRAARAKLLQGMQEVMGLLPALPAVAIGKIPTGVGTKTPKEFFT